MITAWDIYWITRLNALNFFIGFIALIAIIITAILLSIRAVASGSYQNWEVNFIKSWFRPMFTSVTVAAVFMVMFIFIPSTKEVVAIYIIPKIVNNEQVQKLPDNTMKFLNEKLEEWIDDMSSSTKKK